MFINTIQNAVDMLTNDRIRWICDHNSITIISYFYYWLTVYWTTLLKNKP